MKSKWFVFLAAGLLIFSMGSGLSGPNEITETQKSTKSPLPGFTSALTSRLSSNLHVKNVVGDPVKVGKVTVIPIVMIEFGYGGGGGGTKDSGGSGFFMKGEAKPIGFIIISKSGTKFVDVGKVPRK